MPRQSAKCRRHWEGDREHGSAYASIGHHGTYTTLTKKKPSQLSEIAPESGHPSGPPRRFTTQALESGKKKQHKHKLFGPDFPRTFLTLTPGCPGVKKFLPTTGAAGKRTYWCGRPRFSARTSMTRRVVEKLCTKKVCVDFLAPIEDSIFKMQRCST